MPPPLTFFQIPPSLLGYFYRNKQNSYAALRLYVKLIVVLILLSCRIW